MAQPGQITFYTHGYSPYCHRVHVVLEEVQAKYTSVEINLMEKPAWYTEKVNPLGKIPAITYGGPEGAAPEDPSPEAAKIPESLVIMQFLAETFPEARLVPSNSLKRVEMRLFIVHLDTKFFEAFRDVLFGSAPVARLIDAFAALQALLPPTGFAVGEFSLADAAAVPFLVRALLLLENDIGKYPAGEGKKAAATLREPKFARLRKYIEDVKARPSFKNTYDEEFTLSIWKSNPVLKRD